ncbi:MAG TPA: 3-isopropylmalate dehydrogenase [Clostridia bacterium]
MAEYKIAVIDGDGIGPEIVAQAIKVLKKIETLSGVKFNFTHVLMGGCAIDQTGTPLPQETIDICLKSDAVLLGAVGGPKWDNLPGHLRPEKGLLSIRSALGLYANLRPAVLYKPLIDACRLRRDIAEKGIDMIVVRELTGGIYFGERGIKDDGKTAYDTEIYSEYEVERISRIGFELARKRRKHVTSIDKANVLESSRLWRRVAERVAKEYPDVTFQNMLVDNAAMQIIRDPSQFDVIITSNMFGDILSDEASMTTGSIGMLPSASLGGGKLGLYEPIHGSAPDIAGQDKANPIATILSAAMMLRSSIDMPEYAQKIEDAVNAVLEAGYRTGDIMSEGKILVGCEKMGDLIADAVN